MLCLEGIPVSVGYGNGIAVVYDLDLVRRFVQPKYRISHLDVASEWDRLDGALEKSTADLKSLALNTSNDPRLIESAELMSAHSTMAEEIAALAKKHIGQQGVNVEQALDFVIAQFVESFAKLENSYFREREQDIRDVGQRLMRHLGDSSHWTHEPLPPASVIVARELLPSEALELAKSGVIAFVAEYGGPFSHTAILARSLGIPAVTGVANVTALIRPGMQVLVDGNIGLVVIEPTPSEIGAFDTLTLESQKQNTDTANEEHRPCVTRDGIEITLLGNVLRPTEIPAILKHNLAGVGLFRTEFLFLESRERPGFDLQVEIYHDMARRLDELPLVIRTFDLGDDKLPPFLLSENLPTRADHHLRGLRFSLAEADLLSTQLRAILQVAETADVRILFPMVIGGDDFARAIAAVHCAANELGVLRRPMIGSMIETPAALYALDEILVMADFVAIGTNDLTQYMLAADRDFNERVDDCTAMHPAVLRAIRQVVEAAESHKCPVCVCGEEAGDLDFACLLVGLGVRELSVTPSRAAAVRRALRQIDYRRAREIAELALRCQSPQEVRRLSQQLLMNEATAPECDHTASLEPLSVGCSAVAAAWQVSSPTIDLQPPVRSWDKNARRALADSTICPSQSNQLLTAALQEERLAAVAFQTQDSILITNEHGTILRVNKSFTQLTGYIPEDVIGKTPRILKSGRHSDEFYSGMWQAVRKDGSWQGEIWNKRKNGEVFLQRLTIACVRNESDEVTHYVGDGQDLTQQKQAEASRIAIRAAREVQRTLFPRAAPCLPGFDIAGAVYPAESVSGDFYDFIPLGNDSIGMLVADVSGHGLGPALLMAQTQAYLRLLAESHSNPNDLLIEVNRLLLASDSGHFVTMFLGRLDVATRSFNYDGAGHQGYLIAANGTITVLPATSIPLGLTTLARSGEVPTIQLQSGDILVIPTDGTEEAMNFDGQLFGRTRLFEAIHRNRAKSAVEIIEILFQSARAFSKGRQQADDITALIVKVLPASPETD